MHLNVFMSHLAEDAQALMAADYSIVKINYRFVNQTKFGKAYLQLGSLIFGEAARVSAIVAQLADLAVLEAPLDAGAS